MDAPPHDGVYGPMSMLFSPFKTIVSMLAYCARRFEQFHCWCTQRDPIFAVGAAIRGEVRLTILADAQIPWNCSHPRGENCFGARNSCWYRILIFIGRCKHKKSSGIVDVFCTNVVFSLSSALVPAAETTSSSFQQKRPANADLFLMRRRSLNPEVLRYGVMCWTGCGPLADVATQSGRPPAGKGLFSTVTNTPVVGFSLNPVTELSRLLAVYKKRP